MMKQTMSVVMHYRMKDTAAAQSNWAQVEIVDKMTRLPC